MYSGHQISTSTNSTSTIMSASNNGEIMLEPGAQSPILKDQLSKLHEFDSFVESLDKNGSQKDSSKVGEYPSNPNGNIISNSMHVNDQHSQNDDEDSAQRSSTKRECIVIDADDVGGLMGLVSISPLNSPVRKIQNGSTPSAARLNDRTSTSSKVNVNSDSFVYTPAPPIPKQTTTSTTTSRPTADVSLFDPHASVRTPPTVIKQSWVQFGNDDNDDRLSSTSSRGTSLSSSSVKYQGMQTASQFSPAMSATRSHGSSGINSPAGSRFVKDWVKYGAHSPQLSLTSSQTAALNSGGSIHSSLYSGEGLLDDVGDHQSDITASASALSSHRGSFSGSHDNISHEYMPLESPKNMPASIPEGWVKFDETTPTSPTKANIYFVGSTKPGHTRSQSAGGLFADDILLDENNRRRASSSAMASHLHSQPEEILPSVGSVQSKTPSDQASPPLPLQKTENNLFQDSGPFQHQSDADTTKVQQHVTLPDHSPHIQAKNTNNLQQQVLQQQQQQLLLQHQIQKQKLAAVGRQLQQIQEQQLIQTTPQIDSPSSPSLDSVISQSPVLGTPGNPFKEEILKQYQQQAAVAKNSPISEINLTPRSATSSPLNPFKVNNHSTNGDSGIVSASSTCDTFDEQKKNSQIMNSPGNPFKQMMITANVHPQDDSDTMFFQKMKEPNFVDILEEKDSKPPKLPSTPHSFGSSIPQTPSPDKLQSPLTNQTNYNSQDVPFQQQNDTQTGPSGPGRSQEASQAVGVEPSDSFIDEYPREEANPTEGWSLMLRCPDKKKLTGSRYWKPVHVRLIDGNVIQLFDDRTRKEPFRELPLQSNNEFGDCRLQAYDTRGKIHTIKLFYVSYKEKKRFSTLETQEKILNMEPLIKLGSTSHDVFKGFIYSVNEALMKLTAFRDRGRHYEQDMMTITVCDDYRAYIDYKGEVVKQSITVDVSVLAFLSGMPACAIGLNDSQMKETEAVSHRRDIVPNKTEEWIKLEHLVLHKCANKNVFSESRFIEFSPLDGCRFKLLQFKTRPKRKELPMYVKVKVSGENNHIDMRADLYIEARTSKQNLHHHICEDIMVRVPLPEAWIKYFRKEKRIRGFSSIKSVTKKADNIKSGNKPKLIEVSVGSAKYEHAYRAVVWRIDRIPEKSINLAVTHIMRVQLKLGSTTEMPETFSRNTEVEFTMPHTTASKTTVRSLAVATDTSPDKRVRYTAKYEYQVEVEKSFDTLSDDDVSECAMQ